LAAFGFPFRYLFVVNSKLEVEVTSLGEKKLPLARMGNFRILRSNSAENQFEVGHDGLGNLDIILAQSQIGSEPTWL
jgi:hypothetical protein